MEGVIQVAPTSLRTSQRATVSRLANVLARAIRRAFNQSQRQFREITLRARRRFLERDWHGMQRDSAERLDVYEATVDQIVSRIRGVLADRVRSRLIWASMKAVYSGLIQDRDDWEIAETFFNSVTRRIFDTVGVEEEIEFVHSDYERPPSHAKQPAYRTFDAARSLTDGLRDVLAAFDLPLGEEQVQRQAVAAASCIGQRLHLPGKRGALERIEVIDSIFYRGKNAYLIGRLVCEHALEPLVLCLEHSGQGVLIDAVLTDEADVSLLFSFARSYFHVDTGRPFEIVRFLKSIIPRKPRSEIYNSIGYKKHGKTELYRHALRHLAGSTDKYQRASGQRGMVMVVFTMPSYPVVFKIIKDEFDFPKQTTRQAVIDCYRLVFKHDRAGRLVDAQEYQYLTLDRHRFEDELVD
jgi:isocitrate dehydrogenase kinase/phosphatase